MSLSPDSSVCGLWYSPPQAQQNILLMFPEMRGYAVEDHFYRLVYAERTQRLDAFVPSCRPGVAGLAPILVWPATLSLLRRLLGEVPRLTLEADRSVG